MWFCFSNSNPNIDCELFVELPHYASLRRFCQVRAIYDYSENKKNMLPQCGFQQTECAVTEEINYASSENSDQTWHPFQLGSSG